MFQEIIPLPKFINDDERSLLYFSIYRAGSGSNNISLNVDILAFVKIYAFLPQVITQGVDSTTYIVNKKNRGIEIDNVVNFKINGTGKYKYTIYLEAFSDVNGIFSFDLVNASNTPFRDDILVVKNITPSSTIFYLNTIVDHVVDDISKLRFGGLKQGGGLLNINISKMDLIIEKL